ncbi:hypothetical protein CSKR_101982 [Clonorchis sinensis]|uniref:Uncharacterized protein n=1 Tax=Clonorchis sinensis TaxID=79923 RepID=A0A419QBM8_CLOSI|nr:hypothetical protein CSKR_101982 [Clonorchis sinensis]
MYRLTPSPSTPEGESSTQTLLYNTPRSTLDHVKPPKEEVASTNQKRESYHNRKHGAKWRFRNLSSSCNSVERSLFTTHPENECVDRTSEYEQREDNRHTGCGTANRGACVSVITMRGRIPVISIHVNSRQKTYTTQLQSGDIRSSERKWTTQLPKE